MGDLLPFIKAPQLYTKTKASATKRHKKHKTVKDLSVHLRLMC